MFVCVACTYEHICILCICTHFHSCLKLHMYLDHKYVISNVVHEFPFFFLTHKERIPICSWKSFPIGNRSLFFYKANYLPML